MSQANTDAVSAPAPAKLPPPPVRWPVFISSLVGVLAIALWAIIAPKRAQETILGWVTWVGASFGWFYILLATVVVVFVLYIGFSRFGTLRMGPAHSRPEFSTFAWASMLFAAGIGTDVMFFSVVEPVTQYFNPPTGSGETVAAAREATVWTLFHYGVTGWAMYALMGMALGFFAYRLNLPLAVRSALAPIFGKRIDGVLGHAVDTAAVLGTIFGVATSLGIGVVFLNVGLNVLFGVSIGTGAQIGLVVLALVMAAISATTGVDKGIRLLSQLNVLLALGLAAWVLVTGKTELLLEAIVMNVGDFVSSFPGMTMETFAFDNANEWMNLWTLFFWAWWVAWASFVGLFLARISRGRTLRQFVGGVLVIPFIYIVMWVSIFGNSALDRVRGGDKEFAAAAQEYDGRGFFMLIEQFPAASGVIAVATTVGLLFYVTSADSGSLVMGNLCSKLRDASQDCAPWQRIVWAAVTGLLTVAMLVVGGIYALQYATVIMGLPFAFVMILVMLGLYRALAHEYNRVEVGEPGRSGWVSGLSGRPWQQRLVRTISFPDSARAEKFLRAQVLPVLEKVAGEFTDQGRTASAELIEGPNEDGRVVRYARLSEGEGDLAFRYEVWPVEKPRPTYGIHAHSGRDVYTRLEVFLGTGGQGYDVMGYSENQLAHDVLENYEHHVAFLEGL